jgi:glycerol-3-phosphate dehydrogenase
MRDIAVIGGGINGCGIARDAAGRGLSVLLAEKGDLAGGTSSASTKLIHGGLRYLEQYEFGLVRQSLREREVLLGMAPHIIEPLRFVLPHHRGLRPALLIRLGLWLYDHLGGREMLPASAALDLRSDPAGKPLKPEFRRGFEYSDCSVDDARLVVLNAVDAGARGADVRTRTEAVSARRLRDHWRIELRDTVSGRREWVDARALINAAGPWAGDVMARCRGDNETSRIRLVKGSHITVPRLFEHEKAYIFQNADRRIVFAIPYQERHTLIGTTDVDFDGDPSLAAATTEEVDYLCRAASVYFRQSVAPSDVVWTYAGVRTLHAGGDVAAQDATRDFALELDGGPGEAPLLSVIGGKITTYRLLAEEALGKLSGIFPQAGPAWTRGAVLPGGDFPIGQRGELARELAAACPLLGPDTAQRIARTYGTLGRKIFAGVARTDDLGMHFGADLYEPEVAHLVANEWARTADDILWRRTKLGLHVGAAERDRLAEWLAAHVPAGAV